MKQMKLDPKMTAIIGQLSREIGKACEDFARDRLAQVKSSINRPKPKQPRRAAARATQGAKRCYFPGCKNIAAPRFGMFCAALHKNLPQRKKDKIRAARS